MATKSDATITVKGKEYDVNQDFSWKELMLVEELAGMPLGSRDAFLATSTGAAFIFVILKRTDNQLTWEQFLESPVGDLEETVSEEDEAVPTKPRGSKTRANGGPRK